MHLDELRIRAEALVDTQHWARSLPLPERIGFEIVHCEFKAVVHAGTAANGSGSVDGQAANLYVGENFWLRVPKSDLLDEATVEFTRRLWARRR